MPKMGFTRPAPIPPELAPTHQRKFSEPQLPAHSQTMNAPATNPRKERLIAYGVLTLSLLVISALLAGPLWTLYLSLTEHPIIPYRPSSTTGQSKQSSVPHDATDSHSMVLRAAEAAAEEAARAVKRVTPESATPNQATCIPSTSANPAERVAHEAQMIELGCTLPLADPPKMADMGHSPKP
jgi:hypothetical protein